MVVSLPLSAAEFTSEVQAAFVSGVAAAAGVAASNVEITDMVEGASRRSFFSRRLLATSLEVSPSCQPCEHTPHVATCDTPCNTHILAPVQQP